jgi:hypothetical protein
MAYHASATTLRRFTVPESTGLIRFFLRPFGGVELEVYIALAEIGCGTVILLTPISVWNSVSLSQFYGMDTYLISIAFFLSAGLTVVGLVLFALRYRVCSVFRFVGSIFSWIIWSAMSAQTFQLVGFDLFHLVFYMLSALASIRTAAGSWVRWWEPPVVDA